MVQVILLFKLGVLLSACLLVNDVNPITVHLRIPPPDHALVLTQMFLKSVDNASVLINEVAERMRKEGQELGGSA